MIQNNSVFNNILTLQILLSNFTCEVKNQCLNPKLKAIKTTTIKPWEGAAILTVGILGYSLIRKKAAAGTLNFYPDGVRGFRFDGATPVFIIGIGAQNTSNQSFTVNSIACNAYSDGYLVGNFSFFTPQTIAKNSQKIFTGDLRLALIGVVNQLINAYQSNNFQKVLELKGYANVDNLQIPLNLKFKVGL